MRWSRPSILLKNLWKSQIQGDMEVFFHLAGAKRELKRFFLKKGIMHLCFLFAYTEEHTMYNAYSMENLLYVKNKSFLVFNLGLIMVHV